MKMDTRVPIVLMSEMTHGIVEINLIPLPAHQDGLVMRLLDNASSALQVRDSDPELPVKTTAIQFHQRKKITGDAILLHTCVKNVAMILQAAQQTEELNALTARAQIPPKIFSNVIKLTQIIQSAKSAIARTELLVAHNNLRPVNHVPQSQIFSNVIQKH
jgi:hypothetical protein